MNRTVYTRRNGKRYHFSKKCATAGREWCEKYIETVHIYEAEQEKSACRNCVRPRV